MSIPQRPLIDRRRSSSRDRVSLSSQRSRPSSSQRLHPADNSAATSSRASSTEPSGNSTPVLLPSGQPLRSVLKSSSHVHPPPRPDPDDDESIAPTSSDSLTIIDDIEGPQAGKAQHHRTGSASSTGAAYTRRVGFDTMISGTELEEKGVNLGGGTAIKYSFTVSAKSAAFQRTKWSRTFLCGTDLNEYSVHALEWLLGSLVEDNDEVVVFRVIEPGSAAHGQWKQGERGMEECREEAEELLEDIMRKNGERRQISIVVEFAIGPVEETIHRMIEIYKPDSLIVGTRGRPDSLFKSAFMGSISKYCVARSPVPVVVVRPDGLVRESLEKRVSKAQAQRSYVSLLGDKAQGLGVMPPAHSSSSLGGLQGGGQLERTGSAPQSGGVLQGIKDKAKEKVSGSGTKMYRPGTIG